MKEVFKAIPGYMGIYEVSNLGRVKSLERSIVKSKNTVRKVKDRILNPGVSSVGYLIVVLCEDSVRKTYQVHQLVAMAFLNHTPCGYKLVVNHINFNKTDNRLKNLEIVTSRENSNLKHINSSSKYVGVSWCKQTSKWKSSILIDRKNKTIGRFNCELAAASAYNKALLEII